MWTIARNRVADWFQRAAIQRRYLERFGFELTQPDLGSCERVEDLADSENERRLIGQPFAMLSEARGRAEQSGPRLAEILDEIDVPPERYVAPQAPARQLVPSGRSLHRLVETPPLPYQDISPDRTMTYRSPCVWAAFGGRTRRALGSSGSMSGFAPVLPPFHEGQLLAPSDQESGFASSRTALLAGVLRGEST
jgi:hypothetical protein